MYSAAYCITIGMRGTKSTSRPFNMPTYLSSLFTAKRLAQYEGLKETAQPMHHIQQELGILWSGRIVHSRRHPIGAGQLGGEHCSLAECSNAPLAKLNRCTLQHARCGDARG